MKDVSTFLIAAAAVMAVSAGPAFADCGPVNTQTPNLSTFFGQLGSAEKKLDFINESEIFDDADNIGRSLSAHVPNVYEDAPGRSGLAPNSENACAPD
jgi:homospermidine synthase